MNSRPVIIAEVKTHSPFGFKSDKSWHELFEIANRIGDMISIHTDKRWAGSFELIAHARKLTTKPILAKGIHRRDEEIKQALDKGADKVLVVGRVPNKYVKECLIEPISLAELVQLPSGVKVVWNSRDLGSGGMKPETFGEARKIWVGWLCQASHIRTATDINPSADAVLVGSHLPEFAASLSRQ